MTDGGHLNPAVSLSALLTGYIDLIQAILYTACQFAGAIVGVAIGYGLIPSSDAKQPGVFRPVGISDGQLFAWEAIMTGVLVMVVHSVALRGAGFANPNVTLQGKYVGPLIVGLTLTASAMAGGPYTGGALNPARALAPIVVYCNARSYVTIVYIAAEFAGGLVATGAAYLMFMSPLKVPVVTVTALTPHPSPQIVVGGLV